MRFLHDFIEKILKAWSDSDSFISSKIPSLKPLIRKVINDPSLPQEARQHLQYFWDLVHDLKNRKLTEIERAIKGYDQYVEPACIWLHDTPVHAIISRLRLIISTPRKVVNCISELLSSDIKSKIPKPIQLELIGLKRRVEGGNLSIHMLQSIAKKISQIQKKIQEKNIYLEKFDIEEYHKLPLEVIIVEDDYAWLETVASIVREQLGVEPHLACNQKNLRNILNKLTKSRIKGVKSYTHLVVILDLGLPRDDADKNTSHKIGEKILKMLRDFKPNADVIILTSQSHRISVHRLAAQLGVNPRDYILKDLDWEHDLMDSLRRLKYRLNQELLPLNIELVGQDESTGRYIVRVDNIIVPLPPWLYYVFAVLCRHGQRHGLTADRIKELITEEYGYSLEENVSDAIYRLRKAVYEAFQRAERYIEPYHLIRIDEEVAGEVLYRIPAKVRVVDRELNQASEWEVEIDYHKRKVFINGRPIALKPLEFEIFSLLARSNSRVFSIAQIASFVNCRQDDVQYKVGQMLDKIARSLGITRKKVEELVCIVPLSSWEAGYQLRTRAVTWLGSESTNNATEFSVLLVEDDPLWRKTIRQILEEYGYNVFEADSVEEAVQVARAIHPSILCLDLELPEKSGGERKSLDGGLKVLKEVSEFIPDVGAVVITAYAEHGGLRKAVLNAGVRTCDFLQKGEPNWESKLTHSVHRIKREIETASLLPADMESVPPFQGVIRLNRSQPRQMVICLGAEEVIVQFSKNRARLIWTLAEAKGEPVFKDELIETIYESKKPKDPEGALKSLVDDAREDIKEALRRHGKRLKAESVLMTVPGGYRLAGVVIID
jgi:DNA-binding response OmpR family regulator